MGVSAPPELSDRPGVGDPLEAKQMLVELQSRMFGVNRGPVTMGRFVVLGRLGTGAMGIVLSAYDPKLDRKVAIKVMQQAEAGPAEREQLLAEAQAMARLSHPNVITVHDVGEYDGRIFVAMEHVDGVTLAEWEAGRPWREVVAAYRQAGRGLEAAHAAGLIHRDFKPENVLVANATEPRARKAGHLGDGRVRVLDFGLARLVGDLGAAAPSPETTGEHLPLSTVTTNAVAGTPAYMSPEQRLGAPVDARSDQFSFCVALHIALYGQHPFASGSDALDGRFQPPPATARVPRFILPVLHRGLAPEPGDRHPDMGALLEALGRDPARRWRTIAGGTVVAVALAAAAAVGIGGYGDAKVCRGGRDRMAGVWTAAQGEEIRAGLRAANPAQPEITGTKTVEQLDAFARSWETAHREICEATAVHQQQSPILLDARMLCLDRRLAEFEALVAVFTDGEGIDAARALSATHGLASPDDCRTVIEGASPPPDPATRAEQEAIDRLVARASALYLAGRLKPSRDTAEEAVRRGRALGPAGLRQLAAALLRLASTYTLVSEAAAGSEILLAAVDAADRAGADGMRASGLIGLAHALTEQEDYDGATRTAELAIAAAARAGGAAGLTAHAESILGYAYFRAGRNAEARDVLEQALTRARESGDRRVLGTTLNNLALVYRDLGLWDESLETFAEVRAVRTEMFGPDHPEVAIILQNEGTTLTLHARHEEALRRYEQALRIHRDASGPDGLDIAYVSDAMGISLGQLGRLDEAMQQHRTAQAIYKSHGDEARADLAQSLDNMGVAQRRLGELEAALASHRRALQLWEATEGPDHPDNAYALVHIGEALIRLGRPREAVPSLERAVALREHLPMNPAGLGEARFTLARALRSIDPERARAEATAARGDYERAQEPTRVEDVDAWLAGVR